MKFCKILTKEKKEGMHSDAYTSKKKKLWDHGIVPYVFNDNVPEKLRGYSMDAMERIESVSVIKFVKRTYQGSHIEIIDNGEFASYVGKISGRRSQELWVTIDEEIWPNTTGCIMHELMHALGFYHEHCRPDRDSYVVVQETNVDYDRLKESNVLYPGPYDFQSIMHYSEKQGVKLLSGINAEIGQRNRLSEGDIKALNDLYPPALAEERQMILNMINGGDLYNTELNELSCVE